MKYLAIITILLFSLTTFANDREDLCPTVCHKTMTAPGDGQICWEHYTCIHYELIEAIHDCIETGKEIKKIPILCRDVPPAF